MPLSLILGLIPKNISALFIGLALGYLCVPQQGHAVSKRDSLQIALQDHPSDTNGWNAGLELAQLYFGTNLDSAFQIAEQVQVSATAEGNQEFMAQSENIMGISRLFQGRNREAQGYFEKVFHIRKELDDPTATARAANNLALSHQELGEFAQALDYHIYSLKIKEELGDSARIRVSLNNIGLIYENLEDYKVARSYYQEALDIFPLKADSVAYLTNLYNIGITFFKEEQDDSALVCLSEGFPIAKQLGDQRMIGLHHLHFGVIDQRKGLYLPARAQIELALKLFQGLGKQDQIVSAWTYLGINHLETGSPGQAVDYCEKGLQLARETENLEKETSCLQCLHQGYAALGKSQAAYTALLDYHQLRDSLVSGRVHKEIVRKDLEYSFRKQQLADSLETARKSDLLTVNYENKLERQGTLSIFLIIIGGLLLGLAILFYINLRNKKRRAQLLEEKVKIRTRQLEEKNDQLAEYAFINAHLLRQPLAQVLGLLQLLEDAKTETERDAYLKLLKKSSLKLDQVVHEIRDVVESKRQVSS